MAIKIRESFRLRGVLTTTEHRYTARTSDDMLRAITYTEELSSEGSLSRELLKINLGKLCEIEAFVIDQIYKTPNSKPEIRIGKKFSKEEVNVPLAEEIKRYYSPELIAKITEFFARQNPAAKRLWEHALSDS